jgi:phosphoketolase
VDLFKLVPHTEHPHGLTDREFEALFTPDKPVVFNFHAYPWLIHRLTYHRPHQHHIHVRGYKEQGNINTPLELAIRNQADRFSLAIDAIDRSRVSTSPDRALARPCSTSRSHVKITPGSSAWIRRRSRIGNGRSKQLFIR